MHGPARRLAAPRLRCVCRMAVTEMRRTRIVDKDTALSERMAALEQQRRQLCEQLGQTLEDKARQAQAVLDRQHESQQDRAAWWQVHACTRQPGRRFVMPVQEAHLQKQADS